MKTLASTITLPVSPLQSAAIERIDSEDFSGVKRKVREQFPEATEAWIDEGILALKQYYAVALLDPKNEHAVSDTIDPFWHAHILHTRQYARFCDDVYSQFIHHEPLDHADTVDVVRVRTLYDHTQRIYSQLFRWINRGFYPVELRDELLVCKHYEVTNVALREVALFPAAA